MPRTRQIDRGFTLIELMVVLAVIAILAGLVLTAVARGKFKGRVTTCANNYRQLVLASAMYAGEDARGRLPSFVLPTQSTQLRNFINPWIVALPMFKAMEDHGVVRPQMWFCPLRQRWQTASETFQSKFGRPMASLDDYSKYFTGTQNAKYGGCDLNWWVPRPFEGSVGITYPDVALLRTRLKTPWPSRMDDQTISIRPIVSDWILGSKDPNGDSFATASGAHEFGGKIRNINSGYADGHVATQSSSQMKWELQLKEEENRYIFY